MAQNAREFSPDYTNYAISEEDANARYSVHKKNDPYPQISPALLNSADIAAYVKQTALIYPFYETKLKGASYDVKIQGKVVYWEFKEDGKVVQKECLLEKKDDFFDLAPNSIAYVTLEPTFRMPSYLALRFNLKITHIYKGLLLGTGPLVDPGFVGKLSIPLHNMTSNTYRFRYDEELITMEFTKMSQSHEWDYAYTAPHKENYIPNEIKSDRNVIDYINKALSKDRLTYVISSIPDAVNDCKKEVRGAKKTVKSMQRSATIQAAVSVIAVCTLVISAMTLAFNANSKTSERYDSLYKEYSQLQAKYQQDIGTMKKEIDDLKEIISEMQKQGGKSETQIVNNK